MRMGSPWAATRLLTTAMLLISIVTIMVGCSGAPRSATVNRPSEHVATIDGRIVWRSATVTLARASYAGGSTGGYGDVSPLRDAMPSLYSTAWWSCVRYESGLWYHDVRQEQATRTWLQTLMLPGGLIGPSYDSELPVLYRLVLLDQTATCVGLRIPDGWIMPALGRLQQSSGLFSWDLLQKTSVGASAAAAQLLGSRSMPQCETTVGRRLMEALYRIVLDDKIYRTTVGTTPRNRGGGGE